MRRRDASGQWQATRAGLQYFRYLRDEVVVQVGSLRVSGQGTLLIPNVPVTLSDRNFVTEYLRVPLSGIAYGLLTESEKTKTIKKAAREYLMSLPTLEIGNEEYYIIHYDSTPIVWDGKVDKMSYSPQRTRFFNGEKEPSVDVVLNRPLLDYSVPEGCWRPWDLHPLVS
jgi:hypothetical protein